jgi:hypothetical protein
MIALKIACHWLTLLLLVIGQLVQIASFIRFHPASDVSPWLMLMPFFFVAAAIPVVFLQQTCSRQRAHAESD